METYGAQLYNAIQRGIFYNETGAHRGGFFTACVLHGVDWQYTSQVPLVVGPVAMMLPEADARPLVVHDAVFVRTQALRAHPSRALPGSLSLGPRHQSAGGV